MSQLELVRATRLRPGDVLYACQESIEIKDARPGIERVFITTNSRRWSVPKSCQFRRVIRSRRIEMGRRATRAAR